MSRARDIADSKPSIVSDQANTSTGYFDLPAGTTAQRPTLDNAGGTRFNTTTGSLEFYDGTGWVSTNLIPTINSITGTIYKVSGRTLTLSLTNATDTIDVQYYEGNTLLATDTNITVTNGSATSTVPSLVHTQAAGDTITIKVVNSDGTPSSNSIDKTVLALPSGGTETTSGSYYIHSFTSSGTFTNTINNLSVEYLVIAGGGSGGDDGSAATFGGGGAGGYRCNVSGETSGGGNSANNETAVSLAGTTSGTNYTITVGAGGTVRSNGSNSIFATGPSSSITSLGGGCGSGGSGNNANSGGSGGGGGQGRNGASGTTGQGYAGASSGTGTRGCGGGGAGGLGQASVDNTYGGDGGVGVQSSINGTSTYRAGGGGGGGTSATSNSGGSGGNGGGGNGESANSGNVTDGSPNTGGGGGGSFERGSGQGGSGIVIIRYQLP